MVAGLVEAAAFAAAAGGGGRAGRSQAMRNANNGNACWLLGWPAGPFLWERCVMRRFWDGLGRLGARDRQRELISGLEARYECPRCGMPSQIAQTPHESSCMPHIQCELSVRCESAPLQTVQPASSLQAAHNKQRTCWLHLSEAQRFDTYLRHFIFV